jgi:hypothetical protein
MTEINVVVQNILADMHSIKVRTTDTIGAVKLKIEKDLQVLRVAAKEMRLIHNGKKLDRNEQTITDCNIHDGDFLIILTVKKKKKAELKRNTNDADDLPLPASPPESQSSSTLSFPRPVAPSVSLFASENKISIQAPELSIDLMTSLRGSTHVQALPKLMDLCLEIYTARLEELGRLEVSMLGLLWRNTRQFFLREVKYFFRGGHIGLCLIIAGRA